MPYEGQPPADFHSYTDEERVTQLTDLAAAARQAGELFSENGSPEVGRDCQGLAETAEQLLRNGFGREDLRQLGQAHIGFPEWLHPKALDYGMSRQPWQDGAADVVQRIRMRQLELRAVATPRMSALGDTDRSIPRLPGLAASERTTHGN